MRPAKVLISDPCQFGLPDILSVAHVAAGAEMAGGLAVSSTGTSIEVGVSKHQGP